MKKTLLTLLFIFALVITLSAELNKMWISGKAEKTNDIVPAKYQTANRERAACLIIVTDLDVFLEFQVNLQVVSVTHDKPGEWCLYIAPSERRVDIYAVGYEPLIVILREVGIPVVRSGDVYRLRLTGDKPDTRGIENISINVNTNPSNATIYFNNTKVNNPRQILAPVGKNDIRIELNGYKPIIEEINVSEQNTYFEYKLELSMDVPVIIETEPAGATVFLSNVDCGKTPAKFFYQSGEYRLKITSENYATIEEVIEIKEPQTTKKYVLEDIRGTLTIKTGSNSRIYINDQHYPQGVNNLKIAPQLAQIKITTPKSQEIIRSVAIKEKESYELELYPVLDTGAVGISVIPLDAQIELTGDAGERFSSQGSKTFDDVPTGTYQLEIKSDGHKTHRESFAVNKDDVIRKQIVLEEGFDVPEKMVYVKGGAFTMGPTKGDGYGDELPTHSVTLNSFYIGENLVTQKEYEEVMGSNPARSYGVGDDYPVYNVSWYDAIKFCNLISIKEGLTPVYRIRRSNNPAKWGDVPTSVNSPAYWGAAPTSINGPWDKAVCDWKANGYRLPTEAEWEYAARGGTNTPDYLYSGSDDIEKVAWYEGNSYHVYDRGTRPVGSKSPNELGIYDMSGNVWEWCWDWYSSSYYSRSPSNNPKGPKSGSSRVRRGGSWNFSSAYCRVANRNDRYSLHPPPRYRIGARIGFRLCRSVKE